MADLVLLVHDDLEHGEFVICWDVEIRERFFEAVYPLIEVVGGDLHRALGVDSAKLVSNEALAWDGYLRMDLYKAPIFPEIIGIHL